MLRCILTILLFARALPCFAQTPKLDTSIRRVKWDSLIRKNSNFKEVRKFNSRGRKYYSYEGADLGFFDSAAYIDLNHDHYEDAILHFYIESTGGMGGFVVALQQKEGLKFLDPLTGRDHISLDIVNDTMIISSSQYLRDDGTCCPHAWEYDSVILIKDSLIHLNLVTIPSDSTSWMVVDAYYRMLSDKRYKDAYKLLSEDYRRKHPYANWLHKMASTMKLSATVRPSPNDRVTAIVERVVDKNEPIHQRVTWHPIFEKGPDPESDYDWYLDRPEIHEVK